MNPAEFDKFNHNNNLLNTTEFLHFDREAETMLPTEACEFL
jgi:hypothetical protein